MKEGTFRLFEIRYEAFPLMNFSTFRFFDFLTFRNSLMRRQGAMRREGMCREGMCRSPSGNVSSQCVVRGAGDIANVSSQCGVGISAKCLTQAAGAQYNLI